MESEHEPLFDSYKLYLFSDQANAVQPDTEKLNKVSWVLSKNSELSLDRFFDPSKNFLPKSSVSRG